MHRSILPQRWHCLTEMNDPAYCFDQQKQAPLPQAAEAQTVQFSFCYWLKRRSITWASGHKNKTSLRQSLQLEEKKMRAKVLQILDRNSGSTEVWCCSRKIYKTLVKLAYLKKHWGQSLSLQLRRALLRPTDTNPQSIYRGIKNAQGKRSGIPQAKLSLKKGRKKKKSQFY